MANQDVITYLIELQDNVSKELEETKKKTEKLGKAFDNLRKKQDQQRQAAERQAKAMSMLKAGFAAVAASAAAITAGFAAVGTSAVSTAANLEKFETQLGQLLGSAEAGQARVQALFEKSAETPFSIEGLVEMDAKLEAFGVNANRVRDGVLDLAAVTGMDLKDAADAVGRALVGGAGAADMLRDKGVKGWVEQRAGIKATEMSLEQWQEALIDTLDNSEKVAGCTVKLSKTFTGLFSTLRDQWTLFSKDVADAGLFTTVKASLIVILERLNKNREAVKAFATTVGQQLSVAFLKTIEILGFMYDAAIAVGSAFMTIGEGIVRLIGLIRSIPVPANALADFLQVPDSGDLKEYANDMAILKDSMLDMGGAFTAAKGFTEEVEALRDSLMADEGAAGGSAEDDDDSIMRGQGPPEQEGEGTGGDGVASLDAAIAEAAAQIGLIVPTITDGFAMVTDASGETSVQGIGTVMADEMFNSDAVQAFGQEMANIEKELDALSQGLKDGSMSSKDLKKATDEMGAKYLDARAKAVQLGSAAGSHFAEIQAKFEGTMNAMRDAVPSADQMSMGEGVAAGADFLASGGMSALSAAGPYGAAASSLIGMGQQGQQAVDEEAKKRAKESAKAEQDKMRDEAAAMQSQGFSKEEIEAAGLGARDIQEAGQVTEEDIAKEREGIDEDEVMANQYAEMVTGIIDGVRAIIKGLPEILSELIPLLLIDLPTAIVESIPELVEQLIPVLLFELPKMIFTMLGELIPKIFKMLGTLLFESIPIGVGKAVMKAWAAIKKFFADLFDFDFFQTGGFVPKTGMAVLHQGERVIPASGAGTQTASKGLAAMVGGGGPNLTVNTNVVSPDSIDMLGRLINTELGAFGRTTNPIFGDVSPVTTV